MSKQAIHQGRNWYAIHTYAGYEHAVERNLKQRIESLGMQDKIFNVLVPTEKIVKIKHGKKVTVDEKFYPGYVLVEMEVSDDSWYVVRNTPRVTGFVGSGTVAVPMKAEEIEWIFNRMNKQTTTTQSQFTNGDLIIVTDGPFKDFEGKIHEIDLARNKVKVYVNMFGRETPVELDFLQVRKA